MYCGIHHPAKVDEADKAPLEAMIQIVSEHALCLSPTGIWHM